MKVDLVGVVVNDAPQDGLRMATGNSVAFLDSDDQWKPSGRETCKKPGNASPLYREIAAHPDL